MKTKAELQKEVTKLQRKLKREEKFTQSYIRRLHEAEARAKKLEEDMQHLSAHDEACHQMLDKADGEPEGTSSMDTFQERLKRLIAQRDELMDENYRLKLADYNRPYPQR